VIIYFKFVWQLSVLTGNFVISSQLFAAELTRDNISIIVLAYVGKQQALLRWQLSCPYFSDDCLKFI
jgi:hypothetical protein